MMDRHPALTGWAIVDGPFGAKTENQSGMAVMTEAEWMGSTDMDALIKALGRKPSRRKRRLFGCACCRRIWAFIPVEHRATVEVAEQFADGLVGEAELERHERTARVARWSRFEKFYVRTAVEACACVAAKLAARSAGAWRYAVWIMSDKRAEEKNTNPELPDFAKVTKQAEEEELSHQLVIFHDIFANPFRPVSFDPAWRTTTAQQLTQGMYDSRDFGAMPILADALQDAGCDNAPILDHCRGAGPHVRGCWVVDLVLGKE
jgi:hypothetical protein